jgi:hypothetical protein
MQIFFITTIALCFAMLSCTDSSSPDSNQNGDDVEEWSEEASVSNLPEYVRSIEVEFLQLPNQPFRIRDTASNKTVVFKDLTTNLTDAGFDLKKQIDIVVSIQVNEKYCKTGIYQLSSSIGGAPFLWMQGGGEAGLNPQELKRYNELRNKGNLTAEENAERKKLKKKGRSVHKGHERGSKFRGEGGRRGGQRGSAHGGTLVGTLAAYIMVESILFAIDEISEACEDPDIPEPAPVLACVRTGGLVGGTELASATSCKDAIEAASRQADAKCKASTICAGKCPDGTDCKPFASFTEFWDDGWLFRCYANVSYRCECGCP